MTLEFCDHCFDIDMVVLTNLERDHMDVHGSLDNYRQKIAGFLEGKNVILNQNDSSLHELSHSAQSCNFFQECDSEIQLVGKFNKLNAGAAQAAARALEIDEQIIEDSLKEFHGIEGRIKSYYINESEIFAGKTDNAHATGVVLEERKFQAIFLGTPRKNEPWRLEILDEVSKNQPEVMKILVVGAGNAGRPAANLLNYLGNQVRVSDLKEYNSLPRKARNKIKELEKKGIIFELGTHIFDSVLWADAIFISPNIPADSDIRKFIEKSRLKKDIKEITTSDIGEILNKLMKLPMVGIAGTDGKTTTTNMIDHVLKSESFRTMVFSSLQDSLVIEGLVDMVVNEENQSKDFAVFELPHGTIRMAQGLEICAGVLTNLTPDHMDEFKNYEDYIGRNFSIKDLVHPAGILIANGDDPIINQRLNQIDTEYILYGLGTPQTIEFNGQTYPPAEVKLDIIAENIKLKGMDGTSFDVVSTGLPTAICNNCVEVRCKCGNFQRKMVESFKININLNVPGFFNIENALSTMATALVLGFEMDYIKAKLESFNGVKGRFEKIDLVDGVNIFMDAAHNPESMEKLFEGLKVQGRLIVSLDNPDTLTVRDKFKIGSILGKNCDVVIASAKNETTEEIDFEAAQEVAEGSKTTETYIRCFHPGRNKNGSGRSRPGCFSPGRYSCSGSQPDGKLFTIRRHKIQV